MKAKFEAEAAVAQNGKIEGLMKDILQTNREDRAAEIERMQQANNANNANMQQMMQMFAQMSAMGMQTAAGATQAKMQSQAEITNIYKDQAQRLIPMPRRKMTEFFMEWKRPFVPLPG